MGFYTPTGGEITIDGEPLTAANRRRWQNAVGYVSQHVFLLDGTLLENIALGEEEEKIDRRRAEESLRAARLEDFVQSLSAGIDTPIGRPATNCRADNASASALPELSTNRPTFYSSTRRPRRSTAGRRRESTVRSPNCHNTTEI